MTLVFATAIFLSSALLFWLEPLFGKMVLPLLGGAPPAWNACILFYQAALVAGYAWAHAADRIGSRRHMVLHLALALAALAVLPFAVPAWLLPPPPDQPLRWILLVLTVGIGLPFVVVAANGPLLQRAFSRSGAKQARDPYFLYAASNLGSAISLLLYPVVFERFFTLPEQGRGWRWAYVGMIALLAVCAVLLFRARPAAAAASSPADGPPERIAWPRRLRWLALAAIPSSLMLGVTTYISSEVAPVPLIWILPLSLYLGTLVAAFAATDRLAGWMRSIFSGELTTRTVIVSVTVLAVFGAAFAIIWRLWGSRPAIVIVHLLLFTAAALLCHTRLAEDRPSASRLTQYYLWTAIGGTVGGAFNTLVGPMVFTSVLEYPLALAAVIMVLPARGGSRDDATRLSANDLLLPLAVGVFAAAMPLLLRLTDADLPFSPRLLLAIPAVACLAFTGRPVRFGAGLFATVLASSVYPSEIGAIEHAERNFYSVHRVLRDDEHGFRWLTHGVTVHGGQRLADSVAPVPLTYYTPSGPAGDVFRAFAGASDRDIGVIGLGAGAMMFYAVPGQRWTFFEIDPAVIGIAKDPRYFGFLPRAKTGYRALEGDARLTLERDTTRYDILVLDAFSSDAVPVHLLTREAIALYQSRLKPGGLVLMHISNRFFDLGPIVGVMARDAGMAAMHRQDEDADDMEVTGKFGSHWAALSSSQAVPGTLSRIAGWRALPAGDLRVWTDDYSSVVPLLTGKAGQE